MNLMNITTVISLVLTIGNGLAMTLMYFRYVKTVRELIMAVRTNRNGEVEIRELFEDHSLHSR